MQLYLGTYISFMWVNCELIYYLMDEYL